MILFSILPLCAMNFTRFFLSPTSRSRSPSPAPMHQPPNKASSPHPAPPSPPQEGPSSAAVGSALDRLTAQVRGALSCDHVLVSCVNQFPFCAAVSCDRYFSLLSVCMPLVWGSLRRKQCTGAGLWQRRERGREGARDSKAGNT